MLMPERLELQDSHGFNYSAEGQKKEAKKRDIKGRR